jgi:DNA-directed RNA polymerase subunit RPC12/RpoP
MGYKCKLCNEIYEDDNDLSMHLMFEECLCDDSEDNIYKCTLCDEQFEDDSDLGMHLMFGHEFCIRTGKELEQYEAFLKNPVFYEIRKVIDEER